MAGEARPAWVWSSLPAAAWAAVQSQGFGALKEALGGFLLQGSMVLSSVCRRRGEGETVCRKKQAERKGEKLLLDDRGEERLSAPRSDSLSGSQGDAAGPPTAEGVCSAPSQTAESPC